MRTLFIPLAKLLGIYEVFRALFYILIMIFRAFCREEPIESVLLSCFVHAICLILGLILIFKTERIADILKIPQEKTDSLVFNFHSILRVGLVLIGVAALIYAIPSLIRSIGGLVLVVIDSPERPELYLYQRRLYTVELFASILRIVFGGCLVLLSNRLTRLFSKHVEQT